MIEILSNFLDLIENKDWKALKNSLNELDVNLIAELIEEMTEENEVILFRLLSRTQSKEVFQLLSFEKQEEIIDNLANNRQRLTNVLNDIEPDERTAFFEELPGKVKQRLIQLLSPEERQITVKLLGYPEDSIGRLMTPEFIALKPSDTVEHSLHHIRKYGKDSETLNVVYVVDKEWKLIDDIRIKEIILASPQQKIEELMDHRFVSLNVTDDQETAIKIFKDYDRVALPVVDKEGVLIGIVTFDDIMDVVEEEATEDFHKFGSFQDSVTNPIKVRIFGSITNRVGNLQIFH